MPRPICITCRKEMQCCENGYLVHVTQPGGDGKYQIWSGDLWECSSCNKQVLVGFGTKPLVEYFQPKFSHVLSYVKLEI
jgi:hypothetical protein